MGHGRLLTIYPKGIYLMISHPRITDGYRMGAVQSLNLRFMRMSIAVDPYLYGDPSIARLVWLWRFASRSHVFSCTRGPRARDHVRHPRAPCAPAGAGALYLPTFDSPCPLLPT